MTLAIERGEVDGRCGWSWSSIKLQRPDWIADHRLNVLVQLASKRSPELADVPLLIEHATTERQRRIVDVILGRQAMGRPVVAPPGLPEDRKQALRRAFDATMTDPEYLAEAPRAASRSIPSAAPTSTSCSTTSTRPRRKSSPRSAPSLPRAPSRKRLQSARGPQ